MSDAELRLECLQLAHELLQDRDSISADDVLGVAVLFSDFVFNEEDE